MEIQHQISEALTSRAKSLEALGLQELAWAKSDAMELLEQVAGKGVAVLGGDVYSGSSGVLKPAYENWCCERRPEEEFRSYAERSQQEAVSFLRAYPDVSDALFAFVLNEDETAGL